MADEEQVVPEEPTAEVPEAAEAAEVLDAVEAAQAEPDAGPGEEAPPAETAQEVADGEQPPADEAATGDAADATNTDEAAPNDDGGDGEKPEAPADGEGDNQAPPDAEASDDPAAVDGEAAPAAEGAEAAEGEGTAEGEQEAAADEEPKEDDEAKQDEEGNAVDDTNGEDKAAEGSGEQKGEGEEGAEAQAVDEMKDIPQSDTFADGEKPQSPAPHVGEVLSREGSPTPKEDVEGGMLTPPRAETPKDEEDADEAAMDIQDLEEEMMSPEQDRETLIDMYHQAIAEREQLQQQNHQLQHKLAEYFKKKKSDEQKPDAADKNEADQEQRYLKYISQLEELREEDQQQRDAFSAEIEELQQKCEEKQQEVEAHRQRFVEFKHQVALNSINSRSGKPIPPKDIEQYLTAEDRKDQEVIKVRLENIKLKNKLKKKEQQLKSKEELAEGLHLIDFEQLKIENQTYNEKIEERNEELLKLRKKITNTVQVLTHLKEKLQFVQGENTLLKNKLKDVEASVAQKRDVLTRTKQARDALRIDNHRLRQNCGLLGNEPLLRDFEERKDEADSLKDRLERLKMQHAELTLNTASVRRKIEQIKSAEQ